MLDADPELRVVVLAGGFGLRCWPASRPDRPKPLLPFGSQGDTLLADTVRRGLTLVPLNRLAVLTGDDLVQPFTEALSGRDTIPELGAEQFWIEPSARGTGPVLVWAAHRLARENPDAILVSLHADHVIRPEAAFTALIPGAARLAQDHDLLLTLAVSPNRPETGYGYIQPGPRLRTEGDLEAWRVASFVEKPDADTARTYLERGFLWNSGIFLFPVRRFLDEVRTHAPELGNSLDLLDQGREREFFEAVPETSVDEAVLERSDRVGAVLWPHEWDDLGTWDAIGRSLTLDDEGNRLSGDTHAVDARECLVWTEDGPVVLFGVEDLTVVRSGGVTLVTTSARTHQLKELLDRLPERLRHVPTDPTDQESP